MGAGGNAVRSGIFWAVVVLVFAAANGLIAHKESVLRSGRRMLLRLAPRDPRSLIQGDYMVLRYALARGPAAQAIKDAPADGRIVVSLDADEVARFARVHRGEPLAAGEFLLRYRRRGGLRLGAESFFFQEGHARHYERARYGELRVAAGGESVLVGLRGEDFAPLGPSEPRPNVAPGARTQ